MNSENSSQVPPTPTKTEGRKKIKIQRIEDTRSRQVTFLKRKNGLLKKAMELGILCDCEVGVIIFNNNNGKLFEYSSVDFSQILQKYATYNGPSERRKKEQFFDLQASKGHTNIPLNEPTVAQAAMDAAAASARRPRPFYKFDQPDGAPAQPVYVNDRKLSSGECAGDPFMSVPANQIRPVAASPVNFQSQGQSSAAAQAALQPSASGSKVPPLNLRDQEAQQNHAIYGHDQTQLAVHGHSHGQGQGHDQDQEQVKDVLGYGMSNYVGMNNMNSLNNLNMNSFVTLPALTPNTATRQISAAFGLQTPSHIDTMQPIPLAAASTSLYNHNHNTSISAPITHNPVTVPVPISDPASIYDSNEFRAELSMPVYNQQPSMVQATTNLAGSHVNDGQVETTKTAVPEDMKGHPVDGNGGKNVSGSGSGCSEPAIDPGHGHQHIGQHEQQDAHAKKTGTIPLTGSSSIQVSTMVPQGAQMLQSAQEAQAQAEMVPTSVRESFVVAGTPSGLHSTTTPSSGEDHFSINNNNIINNNNVYPRFNFGTSPLGQGQAQIQQWNTIPSADREASQVPLTPFLNFDVITPTGDVSAYGGANNLALPSPSNAGLLPLTPRGLGLDSLLSARPSTVTNQNGKRPFEPNLESDAGPNPKRPFQ